MFAWGTPSRPRASTSSAPGSTTPDGAQPAKAFLLGLVLATYLTGANGRPNSDIARHLRIGPIGERTSSLASYLNMCCARCGCCDADGCRSCAVFPPLPLMPLASNPPIPSCYLICSIVAGPSPVLGSIFQGHALEWNGTAGGKKTSIPSFLSSTSIALRASPPINS